jgi:bacterioferritin-associated ferredoxin
VIVCHCEEVTQRTIKHAINDGAASVSQVSALCGAGRNCGGCIDAIEELLARVEAKPRHVPRWRRNLSPQTA